MSVKTRFTLDLQFFAALHSPLPKGEYCMYLRKSRKDLEAEAMGHGETLENHRRNLLELSRRYGVTITEIYSEVVSGERIRERPEMQRLLEDVEDGRWKGVFVMEVERLARGDTMDQGLVAQAFKYSDTLIVTPMRTYNPNDPNDEEYFEFGLFMSRREFKTTTRRMQWGRKDGVSQGRFVGNVAPYGYKRVKLPGKGYTLEIVPEQAEIVRMIYQLYTHPDPGERKGTSAIARHLNELQIPSARDKTWSYGQINTMIRNPHYVGRVVWGSRPIVKRRDGSTSRPRKPRDEWIEEIGLHDPIIDQETYDLAQRFMQQGSHPPAPAGKIISPVAGLLRCQLCGSAMTYKPYTPKQSRPQVICTRYGCKCKSSYFDLVEERILQSLYEWLKEYKAEWNRGKPKKKTDDLEIINSRARIVKGLGDELEVFEKQKDALHDLVEQGAYSVEVFLERSKRLSEKIKSTQLALDKANRVLEKERKRTKAQVEIIPTIEHVLEIYPKTEDPRKKNELLKSILESIHYKKEVGGRWANAMDKFELILYPKLPQ